VFTQDDLLTTKDFIKAAEPLGLRVSVEGLRGLHENRQLLPLLHVGDDPDPARTVPCTIPTTSWRNLIEVSRAAAEGRLRDPWFEDSVAEYVGPTDEDGLGRWDGLLWSSWQLLDLHNVWPRRESFGTVVNRDRQRTVALCALSARHLPDIRGQASLPHADGFESLRALRVTFPALGVLTDVGVDPMFLRGEGENLIHHANFRDPLRDWLPLVRRMASASWDRLTGTPAYALRLRLAAEVLLRTYEELAETGHVEPLPDFSGQMVSHPLVERLSESAPKPLDSVLADYGLVSHPRLLLLVEGETEHLLLPRLLTEFARYEPEFIRVQLLGGDSVSPQLLARHVVTPRIAHRLGDGWLLDAPLTALMITIDQEGGWATQEQRDRKVRAIREGVRHEVRLQNADIDEETLGYLIHVQTWGQAGCFELANFTDDQLIAGLTAAAPRNARSQKPTSTVIAQLVRQARSGDISVDVLVGRCRTSKPLLADALWPALREKAESEIKAGSITTPVVRVLAEAVRIANAVHPLVRAIRDPAAQAAPARLRADGNAEAAGLSEAQ